MEILSNGSIAAYFDPVSKKIISFDYAHLNSDMIVSENGNGGLSIYDTVITRMDSFVDLELMKKEFIANIVNENEEITLKLQNAE